MSELYFPVYKDLSVRQWPKDAEDNECKKAYGIDVRL